MIEFLIACSPPPDGSNFTCPSPDLLPIKPVSSAVVKEERKNPYAGFVTVPLWRYEWDLTDSEE